MAIAFSSGQRTAGKGVTSLSTAVTTQVGNLIVAFGYYETATNSVSSVTDTIGNSFTKRASIRAATGANIEIWTAVSSATNTGNVIVVHFTSADNAASAALEYSGVISLGVTNTNNGSSTGPTVSLTTQDNNNWIVAGAGSGTVGITSWTAATGNLRENIVDNVSGTHENIAAGDNTVASPGSVTWAVTMGASAPWATAALELRTSSVGPSSKPAAQSYPVCLRMG